MAEQPKHIALRLFEANVGAIETFIRDLIFYRAWVLLGRPRIGARPKLRYCRPITAYGLLGRPRSFEACILRLHRACDLFRDIERLARKRATKLKRILDSRALQLEIVHHPARPSTPASRVRASFVDFLASFFPVWALGARAPP
jgi:hypothetical protein